MSPTENLECVVCFHEYSRSQRVPRLLHCSHTFCVSCLEKLTSVDSASRTICCPVCRKITTFQVSLDLAEALWVNTEIWDQIPKEKSKKRKQDESLEELMRPMFLNSDGTPSKSTLQKVFNCFIMNAMIHDGPLEHFGC
ncbi:RING finger protein 208-like [Stigmatopora argus]